MTEQQVTRSRAEAVVELLQISEELAWASRIARSRQPDLQVPEQVSYLLSMNPAQPGERSIDVLRRFVNLFADEIALVQGARNQVVHSLDPEADFPVEDAVAVGERLRAILRNSASDAAHADLDAAPASDAPPDRAGSPA